MSDSIDKFCVHWNGFESNISSVFQELRKENVFFDVTLACEDEQVQAHRAILYACSTFFRTVLCQNQHEHPLLFLKGIKYSNLISILDFMYQGQVSVAQDELSSFLAVAEDLKVIGLAQGDNINAAQSPTPPAENNNTVNPQISPIENYSLTPKKRPCPQPLQQLNYSNNNSSCQISDEEYNNIQEAQDNSKAVKDPIKNNGEPYTEEYVSCEIKEENPIVLEEYVVKNSDCFTCHKCGIKKNKKVELLNHLETTHFKGQFVYVCPLCVKCYNGRSSYVSHMSKAHRGQKM